VKRVIVHLRTPGEEHEPICRSRTQQPKLTWSVSECSCDPCRRRLIRHPQLFNALMAARQTVLPGTE